MKNTGIIWTCEHCHTEFEVFSDDGAGDFTICWNYCPYCGKRNEIWFRLKRPHVHSDALIKMGIGCEEAVKMFGREAVFEKKE